MMFLHVAGEKTASAATTASSMRLRCRFFAVV